MGICKKLRWTEADVLCPFYLRHEPDARGICCEGYAPGVEAVSRFRSLALEERHMGRYCAGRYESCPVYRCTYGCRYAD